MLTREQKEEIVKDVKQRIEGAKSAVFVDYRGLSVADSTDLKKKLRSENVTYHVIKKKLFLRAMESAKLDIDASMLDGQFAVAFSAEDEVAAAKIIDEFAKENENLKMVGGILENAVIEKENVQALAKLPSKEELLAKLVGTLNSPMSGFVQVLSGNTRNLVQVLKAISESKS